MARALLRGALETSPPRPCPPLTFCGEDFLSPPPPVHPPPSPEVLPSGEGIAHTRWEKSPREHSPRGVILEALRAGDNTREGEEGGGTGGRGEENRLHIGTRTGRCQPPATFSRLLRHLAPVTKPRFLWPGRHGQGYPGGGGGMGWKTLPRAREARQSRGTERCARVSCSPRGVLA